MQDTEANGSDWKQLMGNDLRVKVKFIIFNQWQLTKLCTFQQVLRPGSGELVDMNTMVLCTVRMFLASKPGQMIECVERLHVLIGEADLVPGELIYYRIPYFGC